MAKFTTELEVKERPDRTWLLTAPLKYESDIIGKLTVPKGATTDFASIPRVPIVYALCKGIARRPAVVHDFLYRTGKTERTVADDVFLEAMKCSGVDWFRRNAMYRAVRLFGKSSYRGKV